MITKKDTDDTATSMAQGGIASVLDDADRFEYHIRDTLAAGADLCHEKVVDAIVREGPAAVRGLIELGARFSHADGGGLGSLKTA